MKRTFSVGLLAIGVILSGCQNTTIKSTTSVGTAQSSQTSSSIPVRTGNANSSSAASVARKKKYPTIIDVPSLLGKDFDQVAVKLGRVLEDDSMSSHGEKWFGRQGVEVGISYDYGTNKVTEVFLSMNDDNMPITDIEKLMDNGNLKSDAAGYSVDARKSMNTEGYTGIRVAPR